MQITAIVIDGFHEGHTFRMEYHPTVKLLKPRVERIDYCCDGEDAIPNHIEPTGEIEYKECFRSVDRKVVLYSISGESFDVMSFFAHSYNTLGPWNLGTTLKMGFNKEPVIRRDEKILPRAPFTNFEKPNFESLINVKG